MRATVDGVKADPVDRSALEAALVPVFDLLDVNPADVVEVHATRTTVRLVMVPRTRGGKRVPSVRVRHSRKVVEDQ